MRIAAMVEGQAFYYVLLWVLAFAVWFMFLR
ncbi:Na+-transporting methylmalonyl-CoA/oxaloacetate decarboxylase gamma subunit [Rhizobium giardinii]|uniref:Na+-transporting methylmalonyl-CoA/oxaloacetate decarboxylase gamma subunit n=1 Tax=Rhizobium giardinii TaxID=56731 RepID=A0A7W8U8Z5_9HYPH|nr:Na+-transporting methylmalonyl-CoA/oxaloacetate decarboxylase gamma subunit [Rhizobium giardinii]